MRICIRIYIRIGIGMWMGIGIGFGKVVGSEIRIGLELG